MKSLHRCVTARMTADERAGLKRLARQSNQRMSAYLRHLVVAAIASNIGARTTAMASDASPRN
jgi:hypothetical protein